MKRTKISLILQLLLGLFCFAGVAYSQSDTIDYQAIDQNSYQELKNYIEWSRNYASQKKFDSANKYVERAIRLSKRINNPGLSALVNYNNAKVAYWQTKVNEAKSLLDLVLVSEDINDTIKIKSQMLYGEIFRYEHNLTESLNRFIEVEKIVRSRKILTSKDSMQLTRVYISIGGLQKEYENIEQAVNYYNMALANCTSSNYETWILYLISEAYNKGNRVEDAIKFSKRAIMIAVKRKEQVYLPYYYYSLSDHYLGLGKGDSTVYYAKLGLKNNEDCQVDLLYNNVAQGYLLENKYQNAISNFEEALIYVTNDDNMLSILENTRDAYAKTGDYKNSLFYNEKFLKLKDSLDALRIKQEMLEITEKYESHKKQLEIEVLNTKDKYSSFVIEKQRTQLLLVSLTLLLALLMIGLVGWFYIKQKRQKQLLYEKNVQLAGKLKLTGAMASDGIKPSEEKHKNDIQPIGLVKKNELHQSIGSLIENEFFLDREMTLAKMAKVMGTNTTYLSKTINEDYKKSFANFINDLRISHTLKNLETVPKFKGLTVEHISEEVGFSSSSAFYNAFKKFTGLTPSYYIKKRLQQGY